MKISSLISLSVPCGTLLVSSSIQGTRASITTQVEMSTEQLMQNPTLKLSSLYVSSAETAGVLLSNVFTSLVQTQSSTEEKSLTDPSVLVSSTNSIIVPMTPFKIYLGNMTTPLLPKSLSILITESDDLLHQNLKGKLSETTKLIFYTETLSQSVDSNVMSENLDAKSRPSNVLEIEFGKSAYFKSLEESTSTVPRIDVLDTANREVFLGDEQNSALMKRLILLDPEAFQYLSDIMFRSISPLDTSDLNSFRVENKENRFPVVMLISVVCGLVLISSLLCFFMRRKKQKIPKHSDGDDPVPTKHQPMAKKELEEKKEKPSKASVDEIASEMSSYQNKFERGTDVEEPVTKEENSIILAMLEQRLSDPFMIYLNGTRPGEEDMLNLQYITSLPIKGLKPYPNVKKWAAELISYAEEAGSFSDDSDSFAGEMERYGVKEGRDDFDSDFFLTKGGASQRDRKEVDVEKSRRQREKEAEILSRGIVRYRLEKWRRKELICVSRSKSEDAQQPIINKLLGHVERTEPLKTEANSDSSSFFDFSWVQASIDSLGFMQNPVSKDGATINVAESKQNMTVREIRTQNEMMRKV